VRRVSVAVLLAVLGLFLLTGSVAAHGEGHGTEGHDVGTVDVVEVNGLLDPVLTEMMAEILSGADPSTLVAVVFQIDSTGAVVDDTDLADLADLITSSPVPVSFWIGPAGAKVAGRTAQLVALGDDIGISPGSQIGDLGDQSLPPDRFGTPFGLPVDSDLLDSMVGYEEAVNRGLARSAPVLLEHLVGIDGFEVLVDDSGDKPMVEPATRTRFRQLSITDQVFHTVASPPVAYLLLLVGMGLLIFEFFTAGVGIAGVIGAVSLLLASYGLAVLPTKAWAVGILAFAMVGYAIDIQAGVPRTWTAIGTVSLVLGSLFLFDGAQVGWIALASGVLGTVLGLAGGMPTMVRTRFSTPTIGREWIIGEAGSAVDNLSPEGTVEVRGAVWKARTNRATPIQPGEQIKVVAVEGLWLEVEPEVGAARDHRERSARD
jgi:membrane-bound serine protease (ClpP class)